MLAVRAAAESDATALARLLTELNEAVGASGLPPGADTVPENVAVSAERARQRLRATAGEVPLSGPLLLSLQGQSANMVGPQRNSAAVLYVRSERG